jgi:hypothetical protein
MPRMPFLTRCEETLDCLSVNRAVDENPGGALDRFAAIDARLVRWTSLQAAIRVLGVGQLGDDGHGDRERLS